MIENVVGLDMPENSTRSSRTLFQTIAQRPLFVVCLTKRSFETAAVGEPLIVTSPSAPGTKCLWASSAGNVNRACGK